MQGKASPTIRFYPLLLVGALALGLPRAAPANPEEHARFAPLIKAVKKGDVAAARRLLDQGASPNARDIRITKPSLAERSEGSQRVLTHTVLMLAARAGNLAMVRLLLEKGADVNGTGEAEYTALIVAVGSRKDEVVRFLLERGARPNHRNANGDTAILFAADAGLTELVERLLDKGADINGGSGWTPLMEAAYNGHERVAKLLIARGADVNLFRNDFISPLDCALGQGHREIAAMIRQAGGKGRDPETLRKEREQEVRKRAEEERTLLKAGRDRALTAEDRQIIELVLLDMLDYQGESKPFFGDKRHRKVVLVNRTPRGVGYLMDNQINGELDLDQANDVSLEISEHLAQRNPAPFSLADLRPVSKRILLRDESDVRRRFDRGFTEPPRWPGPWVQIYLPGYSKRRDRAVLRFWFGPSSHGAAGTYLLKKKDGRWKVRWRDFSFFL